MAAAADLTLCVADTEQAVGDSRCLLLADIVAKVLLPKASKSFRAAGAFLEKRSEGPVGWRLCAFPGLVSVSQRYVACWHKCEVPAASSNVRVRKQSGRHLLGMSICFRFRPFESVIAKGMTKGTRVFELAGAAT
jgi:hypothetical protein